MDEDFLKLVELYRDSKYETVLMFNWTISFVTIVTGGLELLKRFNESRLTLLVLFNNSTVDTIFSILLVVLGVLSLVFMNKMNIYKNIVFLLTVAWMWIYIGQLGYGLSPYPSLTHILIIPIVVQLLYMMKASVFLDEIN